MRLELQEVERQQLHVKDAKKQLEKSEDERFRQEMLAKFAEDDRIEQMNAQKRRMKQLEHKRAVEALIDDRRARFEAEKVGSKEQYSIFYNFKITFSRTSRFLIQVSRYRPISL